MDRVTYLIPAAGFGSRVGSPLSKEMLLDSETGEPLIEKHLRAAQENGAKALVITRLEKLNLIEFIRTKYKDTELVFVEKTPEWTDSLIGTQNLWSNRNIVILPDTVFRPTTILKEIGDLLTNTQVVYATHKVDDPKNWGIIDFTPENKPSIWEKPMNSVHTDAWGVMGFQKSCGVQLLTAHRNSQVNKVPQILDFKCAQIRLEEFRDLTRG
ncbi:MAG: hypothetical protein V4736_09155 [Bdellovibrionota bacterium]